MITIQPEAKSQLLCARPGCGHSEDDHNWSTGPCNVKSEHPATFGVHCVCYSFVFPEGITR